MRAGNRHGKEGSWVDPNQSRGCVAGCATLLAGNENDKALDVGENVLALGGHKLHDPWAVLTLATGLDGKQVAVATVLAQVAQRPDAQHPVIALQNQVRRRDADHHRASNAWKGEILAQVQWGGGLAAATQTKLLRVAGRLDHGFIDELLGRAVVGTQGWLVGEGEDSEQTPRFRQQPTHKRCCLSCPGGSRM